MSALNQEQRRTFEVTDIAGQPVTGLVTGDFTLTLQRQSGDSLVAATETPTVLEIGGGLYWAIFTPTAAAGIYRLEITHASHFVNPQIIQIDVEGYTPPIGPYLTTRDNVKAALNITGSDDDARIDSLLAVVTDFIQSYCNRTFASDTLTEYPKVNGYNASTVNLKRYPVTSVTSVHVSTDLPRVYGADELLTADEDYILDEDPGILHRTDGSAWPTGIKAVKVVYVGGYSTIPADLERAAIEIIAVKLNKGKFQLYHVTQEDAAEGGIRMLRWEDIPTTTQQVLDDYRDGSYAVA